MEAPVCALADAMFRLPAKLDRLLASHGHALPLDAKKEIPHIKKDLEKMVAFLQEHDDSGADDHSMMVKCLTKEVRELSYDMEDSVDQYEHAANIRKGIGPRRKKYKVTRRRSKATSGLQEKLKWRLWMANKITEFSLRSQEALERYSLFNHLDGDGISDPPANDGTSSNACPRRVVSFGSSHPTPYVCMDEHVNKFEGLLGKDGEQKLKVVSVVGSGGIGKTTLAKVLYRRIKGQFECRAFVRTSRKPDVRRLLISMLSQIQPHHPTHNWQVHCLIADIRKHLQDKRYLIVIDDVWDTQTWDIIVNALPDGNLCSGILITTEVDDIALKCCGYESKYVHTMKPLGHDDSSKLFFSTAFGPQHDCPPELSEVANNIIRKCDGLPLAVVTVASLLVNQMGKPEQWDYVNKSLGYGLRTNPNSEGMNQVLNLCYNNLPQHLQACVMYLSIYEENYMIWKDDLLKQWIAEGLIRANEEKDKEEISRICFDELVNSRMIQPVHINDNDDVLSCTVHRMVLDFIKHKSLEENFVTAVDHCQTTAWLADKVRRLSLHFGNAEAMPRTNMILSQVRTLAFFGVIKCLPSIVEFGYLQVLILHLWGNDESISVDLTGISELFRLRYLHVTCNGTLELEVRQNQMRGLQYLETLKIDARVSAVPLEIVHLPCLLHLSLPVETNMPNGIGSMTSLSTLGYFDLSVNSIDNVQSLGGLTNLRDLRLTCSTVPSCLEEKMDNMGPILTKLSNLRSVTLEPSSIMDSEPSTINISCDGLSSISSPPMLLQRFEWLPCICSFSSIPKWIGHLNKLCILKIGVRELTSNDVDVLGGLPSLTVLSLYVRGKPAERIVFTKIGFLVLKCFKFRCSAPLLGFEVGAMPNLLKLKLGFDACEVDQLGTIAVDIMHLIGLKEISAKIGGAGAIDPCRRDAELALIDAIKMHPARPTFNIQCLDGMFSDNDDNDSMVQEEEHMTTQKQYDIMEEDSVEQHGILQKGTREDAHSRFSVFSDWKTVGHKQADSRAHPARRIGEIIELSSSKKWTRWLKREALKCKILEEGSNKHHGILQKDYRDDANKHALNRPLEGKGKASVVTIEQMAQMFHQAQDSVMGRLPNMLATILGEHFGASQSSIMGCIEDKVQSIVKTEMQERQAASLPSRVYEPPRQTSEGFPETGGITRVKLRFVNADRPEDPLFTDCPVKWQNGENPKVAIFENDTQITQGDLSKLQIEILAVYADFFTEQGHEGFTKEEFSKQICMCNGKELVLKTVQLTDGECSLGPVIFTESSQRKNLRLTARVKRQDLVVRVQEAITDPFVVKDRRSISNKKSYPPSKEEAVHCLEGIAADGKHCQYLAGKSITTVKHFMRHYHMDKFGLQKLTDMKEENWSTLIKHATTSDPGVEIYSYGVAEKNIELLFNDFYDLVGMLIDRLYVPVNDLDQLHQRKANNWKKSAYKKFDERESSGGLTPDYFMDKNSGSPVSAVCVVPLNKDTGPSVQARTTWQYPNDMAAQHEFGDRRPLSVFSQAAALSNNDAGPSNQETLPFSQPAYGQTLHQGLGEHGPSIPQNGTPYCLPQGNILNDQGQFSAQSTIPPHNLSPFEDYLLDLDQTEYLTYFDGFGNLDTHATLPNPNSPIDGDGHDGGNQ